MRAQSHDKTAVSNRRGILRSLRLIDLIDRKNIDPRAGLFCLLRIRLSKGPCKSRRSPLCMKEFHHFRRSLSSNPCALFSFSGKSRTRRTIHVSRTYTFYDPQRGTGNERIICGEQRRRAKFRPMFSSRCVNRAFNHLARARRTRPRAAMWIATRISR